MATTANETKTPTYIDPRSFDPRAIWYGPHACVDCQQPVVTMERERGGIALNQPNEPIYPNTKWTVHECPGTELQAQLRSVLGHSA